jgi:hypothetical protein
MLPFVVLNCKSQAAEAHASVSMLQVYAPSRGWSIGCRHLANDSANGAGGLEVGHVLQRWQPVLYAQRRRSLVFSWLQAGHGCWQPESLRSSAYTATLAPSCKAA